MFIRATKKGDGKVVINTDNIAYIFLKWNRVYLRDQHYIDLEDDEMKRFLMALGEQVSIINSGKFDVSDT